MTAARQERKPARCRVFFTGLAGASVVATIWAAAFVSIPVRAATTEWVVTNRYTGLAIDGFDPVAYFVEAAPKEGRAELEFRSDGAVWRFLNEGNRSAFAAAPEVYTPRFGGHDPMALARGAATPGHPALWLIAEQRLYLFYSAEARAAFARDPEAAIEIAERNWPAVQHTLVRN
jgi:hypothetical protein